MRHFFVFLKQDWSQSVLSGKKKFCKSFLNWIRQIDEGFRVLFKVSVLTSEISPIYNSAVEHRRFFLLFFSTALWLKKNSRKRQTKEEKKKKILGLSHSINCSFLHRSRFDIIFFRLT